MAQIEVLLAKYHRIGLTVAASLGIHGALMGIPLSFDAEPPKPESLSVVPLEPLPPKPASTPITPALPVSSFPLSQTELKFNPTPPFQWNPYSPPSSGFGSGIASNIASGNFPQRTTSTNIWQQLQQNAVDEELEEALQEEIQEEVVAESPDEAAETEETQQPLGASEASTPDGEEPANTPENQPPKPKPRIDLPPTPSPVSSNTNEEERKIAEENARSVLTQLDTEILEYFDRLDQRAPDRDAGRAYLSSSTDDHLASIRDFYLSAERFANLKGDLFNGDALKNDRVESIHLLIGKSDNREEPYQLLIEPFEKKGFQLAKLEPEDSQPGHQKYQAKIKEKTYFELELIPLDDKGTLLIVWKYSEAGTI